MYNPTAGKDIQGWMGILCLLSVRVSFVLHGQNSQTSLFQNIRIYKYIYIFC